MNAICNPSPSTWGAPFDAPDATPAVSAWNQAGAILDAAVTTAVRTPISQPKPVTLATPTASVSFTPNGETIKVVSRGVENWGTRTLTVVAARELYRKLQKAGFLVW